MTLGDSPMAKVTADDVQNLKTKLIEEFNFYHLDNTHGRNYITVNGKLMMIDFEEWENLEDRKQSSVARED